MKATFIRSIIALTVAIFLYGCSPANEQAQAPNGNVPMLAVQGGEPSFSTGIIYDQPPSSSGGLLFSSWSSPDGNASDQYVWDNFTLASSETITEIHWRGGYDPLSFGSGGPVIDFTVAIYPSIPAGTQPDVNNPLVTYQTGGNAGETMFGTIGNIVMYDYAFALPASFAATGGTKYWIQIEAWQRQYYSPDWGLAKGTGGDGWYFRKYHCGDIGYCYQPVQGDAAFTLLGPVPDTPTPTDTPTDTPTSIFTDTPTDTPTDTATLLPSDTPTNTPTNLPTDTATSIPTNSPTNTATYTPTDTATNIPTDTATSTPTHTETNTPTNTATNTPTDTATSTQVNTPTDTATDLPTPTATYTPTNTPTNTATPTAVNTPTHTATHTPTNTDTPTASHTPTNTATNTPMNTATHTPTYTPISNIPGKVNGGGVINSTGSLKATFGFTVSYDEGNSAPKGNLVYQDHTIGLRLNATSFNFLVIDGDHAWFTGTGFLNDGRAVTFTVEVDDLNKLSSVDSFSIHIPAVNGYQAGGTLSGGNITIH